MKDCAVQSTGILETASALRDKIYAVLQNIGAAEAGLEHSYIKLGELLLSFEKAECWRAFGYNGFNAFLAELYTRFHKRQTQLYQYTRVAEKLLPYVSAATLDQIGISKAIELKRALKYSNKPPRDVLSAEIVDAARDSKKTIRELRALLQQANALPPDEKLQMVWVDFGGAFMSAEQKAEYLAAVKMTLALLDVKRETPEWLQHKIVFEAWYKEFAGTHTAEVYGPAVENRPAQFVQP